jgi:hypothetical protein
MQVKILASMKYSKLYVDYFTENMLSLCALFEHQDVLCNIKRQINALGLSGIVSYPTENELIVRGNWTIVRGDLIILRRNWVTVRGDWVIVRGD